MTTAPRTTGPSNIELRRVQVPLMRAVHSAHLTQTHRESILIRWERVDGVSGYSECPTLSVPGYVTETTDAAWAALVGELGPAALVGRVPVAVAAPAAAAALVDAALDAALRAAGISLRGSLAERSGLPTRAAVPWCAVVADVGLDEPGVIDAATSAVADGAALVKLKVQGDEGAVRMVRRVFGELAGRGVALAIDANGSLSAEGVAGLDGLGLAYIEQPLPPGTPWERLAGLCRATATPLALDESLTSPDAVADAVRAGAVDVVSVKPARLGGCVAASQVVARCADSGVACFVGGMFELGIGRAAALGVASLGGCTLPTDLGPSSRYVRRDLCEPLVTRADGQVVVPDGPGLGREPAAAVVEELTVQRALL